MSISKEPALLTFSRKDFEIIDMPHIDHLVVSLKITNFVVKIILINEGSSGKDSLLG